MNVVPVRYFESIQSYAIYSFLLAFPGLTEVKYTTVTADGLRFYVTTPKSVFTRLEGICQPFKNRDNCPTAKTVKFEFYRDIFINNSDLNWFSIFNLTKAIRLHLILQLFLLLNVFLNVYVLSSIII